MFAIPALIWGSTWYVIKFQLGMVDPLLSVAYRFILAGLVLLAFCIVTGKRMRFTTIEHALMLTLGLSLFGFNYWLVYEAETILTSGIVAVIFSLIIVFNILLNALFLKGKIKRDVIFAALLGISGTVFLFKNELSTFSVSGKDALVYLICFGGILLASTGNIISAYQQKRKIPVLQANAFGMIYGGIAMFITVLLLNKPVIFDFSAKYILSLLYLAAFGSIAAFSTYLKLLGEIGPDRAVYIAIITPAIAIVISSIFEGYQWDMYAFFGIFLLFSGNILALRLKTQKTEL